MNRFLILFFTILLFTNNSIHSQEFQKKSRESVQTSKAVLIINSDNISKMLLIDTNGKWIAEARQIKMTTSLGQPPKIECKIYRGLYEPSEPEVKNWQLSAIVNTNNEEFKAILDDLQDGTYDKGR